MVFYNDKLKQLPKEILEDVWYSGNWNELVETNNKIKNKEEQINKLKEQVMDLDLMLNYLIYKSGDYELQKKN